MNPTSDLTKGWTEVIIDNDCESETFYMAAEILQSHFMVTFTNKLNNPDTMYWDFEFKDSKLVFFYNIYEGTTIFPRGFKDSTQEDNDAAVEIGTLLYQKINSTS